jgi:hypothetical protein
MKESELRQIRLIAAQRGVPADVIASILGGHAAKELTPQLLVSIGKDLVAAAPDAKGNRSPKADQPPKPDKSLKR